MHNKCMVNVLLEYVDLCTYAAGYYTATYVLMCMRVLNISYMYWYNT